MKKTREEFITKANLIHNNKYDYSEVIYIDSKTKVKIICPKHGIFEQAPSSHLRGDGCPKCSIDKQTFTTEQFLEKAKKIHPEYDYSETNYVNAHTKIVFSCPKHGKQEVAPMHFFNSYGCPECGKLKRKETRKYFNVIVKDSRNNVFNSITEAAKFYKVSNRAINNLIKNKKDLNGITFTKETISTKEKINKDICQKWNLEILEKVEGLYEENNGKKLKKYTFKCNKCGNVWKQGIRFNRNLSCPKCYPYDHCSSKGELELFEHFKGKINVIHQDRKILKGKELDIWFPDLNIAIEYDGKFWHKESRDKEKNEMCEKLGIKLIRIDNDYFIKNRDLVFENLDKQILKA